MNNLNRGENIPLSRFINRINSISKGKILIHISESQPEGKVYCVDILEHVKSNFGLKLFPYQENILNRMDKRYCVVMNEGDLKEIPSKPNVIIERGN